MRAIPVRRTVVALIVLLTVSACGGDDDEAPEASTAASTAVAALTSAAESAAEAAAEAATSVAAGASAEVADECAEAALSVRAALTSAGDTVTDVKVIGQCTGISVATNLTADKAGADVAKALCTTAGSEAYAKGVTSVSIDAADGTEIAIGVKDAPCIGPFG